MDREAKLTEGTLPSTHAESVGSHNEIVEVFLSIRTGLFRSAVRLDTSARASTLKTIFSSIMVQRIQCEARQSTTIGSENHEINPNGNVFVALIPTGRNTEVQTGTNSATVKAIPNKQTMPLSSVLQEARTFDFDLSGFELDLACDPRRQQGLVLWIGNTGVTSNSGTPVEIVSTTWRIWVKCSGNSTLW